MSVEKPWAAVVVNEIRPTIRRSRIGNLEYDTMAQITYVDDFKNHLTPKTIALLEMRFPLSHNVQNYEAESWTATTQYR